MQVAIVKSGLRVLRQGKKKLITCKCANESFPNDQMSERDKKNDTKYI